MNTTSDHIEAELRELGYDIRPRIGRNVHATRGPKAVRGYPLEVDRFEGANYPKGDWCGRVRPRTHGLDGGLESIQAHGFTRLRLLEELRRLADRELRAAQLRHAELTEHLDEALKAERRMGGLDA